MQRMELPHALSVLMHGKNRWKDAGFEQGEVKQLHVAEVGTGGRG